MHNVLSASIHRKTLGLQIYTTQTGDRQTREHLISRDYLLMLLTQNFRCISPNSDFRVKTLITRKSHYLPVTRLSLALFMTGQTSPTFIKSNFATPAWPMTTHPASLREFLLYSLFSIVLTVLFHYIIKLL